MSFPDRGPGVGVSRSAWRCGQRRRFPARIFLWLTGWGQMAFPGPRGDWWATIIAPTLGAIFGAYLYDFMLRPFMPKEAKPEVEAEKKPTPFPEKVPA